MIELLPLPETPVMHVIIDADYIPSTTAFEGLMPAGDPAAGILPSKLFAKYPGDLGNSLGAYIVDAASWASTPTAIQGEFDAELLKETDSSRLSSTMTTGAITGAAGTELEKYALPCTSTVGAKRACKWYKQQL